MSAELQRLGLFGQSSYTSIGDEYQKKVSKDARTSGKQFLTNPPRKGRTSDTFFEKKFNPLLEGDKYVDPGTTERKARKEEMKKNLTSDGFRHSSPPKKMTGLGSYFGCIGGKYAHEVEHEPVKKGESIPKVEAQPKNILTNPAKKGTFGVPNTGIGKVPEHYSDPYDAQRQHEMESRKQDIKKRMGPAFKGMAHNLDFFDSQPNVAASRVYTTDVSLPPPKEDKKKEKVAAVPFKPSSPQKSGKQGTFSSFPVYKEDPLEEKLKREREEKAKNKVGTVFKPVSNPKSTPTRSIVFNKTN